MAALLLTLIELRKLSCELECDVRSVRKEIADPGSVRGMVGDRIRRALRERGIAPPTAAQQQERAA